MCSLGLPVISAISDVTSVLACSSFGKQPTCLYHKGLERLSHVDLRLSGLRCVFTEPFLARASSWRLWRKVGVASFVLPLGSHPSHATRG